MLLICQLSQALVPDWIRCGMFFTQLAQYGSEAARAAPFQMGRPEILDESPESPCSRALVFLRGESSKPFACRHAPTKMPRTVGSIGAHGLEGTCSWRQAKGWQPSFCLRCWNRVSWNWLSKGLLQSVIRKV